MDKFSYSIRFVGCEFSAKEQKLVEIEVYRAQTVDEACAVALGYFRNTNNPDLEISVYQGDKLIVIFKHE